MSHEGVSPLPDKEKTEQPVAPEAAPIAPELDDREREELRSAIAIAKGKAGLEQAVESWKTSREEIN